MKRTIPVVLFLLLLAGVARADGSYLVIGTDQFYVSPTQNLDVVYSYVLNDLGSVQPTVSNMLIATSMGPFTPLTNLWDDLQWSKIPGSNSGMVFDLETTEFTPTDQIIDGFLYNSGWPTGPGPEQPFAGGFTVTAISTPEPAEEIMLLAALTMLYGFRWFRKSVTGLTDLC